MSVDAVMARISEIQIALAPPVSARASTSSASGAGTAVGAMSSSGSAGAGTTFASMLGTATAGTPGVAAPVAAMPVTGATAAGSQMIALAQQELAAGVAEQPPGSNDSPRIAQYRAATPGGGVGPWCSYFVSWLANQAGAPIGDTGQGFAAVDALHAWSDRTGRSTPTPAPGELIVWDEHVGLVTGVDKDGTIHTIEGNSSDRVSARTYGPDGGGALTYVKVG